MVVNPIYGGSPLTDRPALPCPDWLPPDLAEEVHRVEAELADAVSDWQAARDAYKAFRRSGDPLADGMPTRDSAAAILRRARQALRDRRAVAPRLEEAGAARAAELTAEKAKRRQTATAALIKVFKETPSGLELMLARDPQLVKICRELDGVSSCRNAWRPNRCAGMEAAVAALAGALDGTPMAVVVEPAADLEEAMKPAADPFPQTQARRNYLAFKSEMAMRGEKLAADF